MKIKSKTTPEELKKVPDSVMMCMIGSTKRNKCTLSEGIQRLSESYQNITPSTHPKMYETYEKLGVLGGKEEQSVEELSNATVSKNKSETIFSVSSQESPKVYKKGKI